MLVDELLLSSVRGHGEVIVGPTGLPGIASPAGPYAGGAAFAVRLVVFRADAAFTAGVVAAAAFFLVAGFDVTVAVRLATVSTAAIARAGGLLVLVESSIRTSVPRIFLRALRVAPFARGSVKVVEVSNSLPVRPTKVIRLSFDDPLTTSLIDTPTPLPLGTHCRGIKSALDLHSTNKNHDHGCNRTKIFGRLRINAAAIWTGFGLSRHACEMATPIAFEAPAHDERQVRHREVTTSGDAGGSSPSTVRRKSVVGTSAAGQTELMGLAGRPANAAGIVRPATEEDLDQVVDQIWDVAAEGRWIGTEIPFDREARGARLGALVSGRSATLLVADTSAAGGPGIVGHISVDIAPYGVADIGMLIVEGWRGQGLGTAMLDAAINWASAAGAHKMALEVWPHNTAAIELYRRAGFEEEGRKRRHYRRRDGELWDAVLMGRSLPRTTSKADPQSTVG
jgi:RimJ/RimL family protein N-acetyltransferase